LEREVNKDKKKIVNNKNVNPQQKEYNKGNANIYDKDFDVNKDF